MIRASKVHAVARFELVNVVRRWSYLLSTFGLPILFSVITGGLLALQGHFLQERVNRVAVYALVDDSGVLRDTEEIWSALGELEAEAQAAVEAAGIEREGRFLTLRTVVFRLYGDRDEAIAHVRGRKIDSAYLVASDYLASGKVEAYAIAGGPLVTVRGSTVEPVLAQLLTDRILVERVTEEIAARVRTPMNIERSTISDTGEVHDGNNRTVEQLVRMAVPFMLGVLLLTALLSASGYLVQAVSVDKESKVVEVLLSSADPDELLTGKLIGLGAAGLIQFFVWSAMVVAGALLAANAFSSMALEVPWEAIAVSPLFFVLGYLFIGSLMLATGSLGTSAPESQKLTLGWAMLAVVPLMMLLVLLEEPHGVVGQVLTWIPFSAPLTVIVRLSVDPAGIAAWEVIGALGVLLASTWLSIRLGARLFRVGLLLTGSRPSWREILRQARLLD